MTLNSTQVQTPNSNQIQTLNPSLTLHYPLNWIFFDLIPCRNLFRTPCLYLNLYLNPFIIYILLKIFVMTK